MRLELRRIVIQRKRAFRISRGMSTETENLFISIEHDGIRGIGEMAPVGYGMPQTADSAEAALAPVAANLTGMLPDRIAELEELVSNADVHSAARAALNVACWDWVSCRARLPLYRYLGLVRRTVATSMTVGICEPEEAREQALRIRSDFPDCAIKIKMGSQDGYESDQERYEAIRSVSGGAKLRVDANGGWATEVASSMVRWLAERGCEYVEQPVHHEDEDGIRSVFSQRKLPIFLDENIHTSPDVPRWAPYCDGVNLKLMKTGGISEAMRSVAVARAMGLSTMIGCMSESSVGIAAGAHIASLFDHVDLDSHFNMNPDPAEGLVFENGKVLPSEREGLGVCLK